MVTERCFYWERNEIGKVAKGKSLEVERDHWSPEAQNKQVQVPGADVQNEDAHCKKADSFGNSRKCVRTKCKLSQGN